jgi:hypothetical protein
MPTQPSILTTTIVVPVAVYLQEEAIGHPDACTQQKTTGACK